MQQKIDPLPLKSFLTLLIILFYGLFGCSHNVTYSPAQEAKFMKPTVAVMGFENLAPISTGWQIGDGLADQLIDRLIHTHRYVVLERQQLNAVFRELKFSTDKRFRTQARPDLGRLIHVNYLIKGTITDFGHVKTVDGAAKIFDWKLLGASSYSIVSATLYVVDVSTGQIIASTTAEAKVKSTDVEAKGNYKDMAFGGHTFYKTSLGRATSKMLDKAVHEISMVIAEQPFQPKIASIINSQVVITGGKYRHIELGEEYIVRSTPKEILDPDSGDFLGYISGQPLGKIRVVQVTEKYAIANLVREPNKPIDISIFVPGQPLFKVSEEMNIAAPTGISNY